MSSPEVDQLSVLNRLMRETLSALQPRALLLLGCSSGNGLEHVDPAITTRVTGVDINPAYLARLAEKFPAPRFALDLRCADVTEHAFEPDSYDVVHAALLLEYLDWVTLLPKLAAALRPGGTLSLVLQRPSPTSAAVASTAFPSLLQLRSLFRFVEPDELIAHARPLGLVLHDRRSEPLRSGKSFEVINLRR
jgi:SAM-dependent methyltransferase